MTPKDQDKISPSILFWVISIIAFLWYLMDMSAFFMRIFISEEALLAMSDNHRQQIQDTPLWVNCVFAFEVFGGTLGSVGLLLRKKWALALFVISLLGVLAQTTYIYFLSNSVALMGWMAIVMPLVAIAIGAGLIIHAKSSVSKGWLR
ncbi:MAG: hypothetical protein COA75_08560 [Cellvibrionales bacterium]|nr:MAG: hypothetical protein COA75_08560 [Cellvibrionales bacterium]